MVLAAPSRTGLIDGNGGDFAPVGLCMGLFDHGGDEAPELGVFFIDARFTSNPTAAVAEPRHRVLSKKFTYHRPVFAQLA
jgi:hypothetical protein